MGDEWTPKVGHLENKIGISYCKVLDLVEARTSDLVFPTPIILLRM